MPAGLKNTAISACLLIFTQSTQANITRPQFALGEWFAAYAQRSRFAELFRSKRQSSTDTSELLDELYALPPEEWPARLRRMISDAVSLILRRTIDPDHPLSEYGLDSMGNLELRTRIEAETGIRVTTNDITTIQGLAGLLCEKLASHKPARHRRDRSDIEVSAEAQVLD